MQVNINELRTFDALATRTSLDLASRLAPADLSKPTPCAAWTLYGLLAHMASQHNGFAASANGDGDPVHWKSISLGDDPIATYRASVDRVLGAFAVSDIADRKFPLPEFSTETTFTAEQALTFHFVDYVVHSWDVARTLGLPVRFEKDLLDAAIGIAESVPSGELREVPGAPFSAPVATEGVSGLDKVVALLGRSPSWPDQ